MPNPDAMELPRATYRSPRCNVEPIEVVVADDATELDDADGPPTRGDELSLEQPFAPSINEAAAIIQAVREMAFVISSPSIQSAAIQAATRAGRRCRGARRRRLSALSRSSRR